MKKTLLLLLLICLPVLATEIWLGVVCGMENDSLLLVDGPKIYVPGLSLGKFVAENNMALDPKTITFPFKASLVITQKKDISEVLTDRGVKPGYGQFVYIKIHNFCEIKDGRLVDK